MSDQALQPIDQRTVIFYDDEITAVVVEEDAKQVIYVPIRPICDFLGVAWDPQRRRINRDPVLADVMMSVTVTVTDIDPSSRRPRSSDMLCLPLDYLNGWLFGINAARVKEEIRERLITYQRECYRVLADAFLGPQTAVTPTQATLLQVEQMGLAIAQMAREQLEFDRRLSTTEERLERAARAFGDLTKRVTAVEQRLSPGEAVTEEQASQISQAVKAVALAMGKKSGKNEFGATYGELYRRFGVTSYKLIPARQFDEVMKFLTDWHQSIVGEEPF